MWKSHRDNNQGKEYLKYCEKDNGNYCKLYIGRKAGWKLSDSIAGAKKSIKIASPFLGKKQVETLREKKLGGLEDIMVVTAVSNDTWSKPSQIAALRKLIHREKQKDVKEYVYTANFKQIIFDGDLVHEKLYIVDDEIAYIGSYNFTENGMVNNYETNIIFTETDTLTELTGYFARLFNASMKKWDISDLGKRIYNYDFWED